MCVFWTAGCAVLQLVGGLRTIDFRWFVQLSWWDLRFSSHTHTYIHFHLTVKFYCCKLLADGVPNGVTDGARTRSVLLRAGSPRFPCGHQTDGRQTASQAVRSSTGEPVMIQHPNLGLVQYEVAEVSDDPQIQVRQVIGMMQGYVLADAQTPEVMADAQEALAAEFGPNASPNASSLTDRQKAEAVFNYVRSRVGYQPDADIAAPLQPLYKDAFVEVLVRPLDMATMCNRGECGRVGDCDDFAMYGAALLRSLGVQSSFVTIAADPRDPSRFSHVYLAAYTSDGERIPLDVSHGPYPGWETTNVVGEKREWPVEGGREIGWLLLSLLGVGTSIVVGLVSALRRRSK